MRMLMTLFFLFGFVGTAGAHAVLKDAIPPVGGTVSVAPRQVTITFSEAVEPAFSTIEVTDSAGKRVDSGKVQTGPGNRQALTVDLQPLAPGSYEVRWRIVSVDTHRTEGNYTFSVGR